MTNQEITNAKFAACMTNTIMKLNPFELNENKLKQEYNKKEFTKILIKNDLEEYGELLFDYFSNILDLNNLNVSSYFSFYNNLREKDEFRLELLEVLHFLLIQQNDLLKSITLQKSRNKHSVKNEKLIFEIERFLEDLFKKNFAQNSPTNPDYIELNLINVEKLILKYEMPLARKPGAPVKNQYMVTIATEIADLVRVNQFLHRNDITDIDKIKIIAKNYRLIYEILDFWGFMPDREDNTSSPEKYLGTTIKQSVKHLTINLNRKERFTALKQELSPFIST